MTQVKGDLLAQRDSAALKAVKYDSWLTTQADERKLHMRLNEFYSIPPAFLPKVRCHQFQIACH